MSKKLRILVACEESQAVTIELRKLGHEAYSCDIMECSGGHQEWHIQDDMTILLNGFCTFVTSDGMFHKVEQKWDMIIAFPPCIYLTNAGTRHYSLKCNPVEKVEARKLKRVDAFNFVMKIANANCDKIAIENPVGWLNSQWRKPNQIIHPYYFGDPVSKRTCIWLKGLPELKDTDRLPKPEPMYICQGEKTKGKKIGWCEGIKGTTGGQAGRSKARSKTFTGIAKAMANQWAGDCNEQLG